MIKKIKRQWMEWYGGSKQEEEEEKKGENE